MTDGSALLSAENGRTKFSSELGCLCVWRATTGMLAGINDSTNSREKFDLVARSIFTFIKIVRLQDLFIEYRS